MNTFGKRTMVCFERGEGMYLWDTSGRRYTDFFGGIAVNVLGHAHPVLRDAICSQAGKLIHCSSIYYIENQAKLAEIIVKHSCADKVFFSNSGAEANEGAIKLARMYFSKKGMHDKYRIITAVNSFHGRTLTTLAATGQNKFHKNCGPMPQGFSYVPLNDIQALESAICDETCAVMLEPIQGESGVRPADLDYVAAVRKLCDDKDILMILDEVQTGMGRTGKLFGYQHTGVEPDIFTLAKGLGGGVPIGALCAKEHVALAFEPGDHGSTFGGNPLACAAGLAVMNTIISDDLAENASTMGAYLKDSLKRLPASGEGMGAMIKEVRGTGLMVGIEMENPKAAEVRQYLFEKGFLVGSVGSSIIRLLPPLIVRKPDIDALVGVMRNTPAFN
ncbi:MAG: aspartate aminotransferase family protein [Eubacteriales bacterium]|nr:aspartate aminotransferase family protein [Eubacteriales bacterium]